jgi:non-specific serine/threonine protein kinase
LRRLKSDKSIIADLPEKTEMTTWCTLSKKQAQVYAQFVDEFAAKLESSTGVLTSTEKEPIFCRP